MNREQSNSIAPRDRTRLAPVTAASDLELPPPLPVDMVDGPTVNAGAADTALIAGAAERGKWSLSLPTRADLFDRAQLGQVILGTVLFGVYSMTVLGFGQDFAAYMVARPVVPGVLIPLLAVAYVRVFRAQAFGRGIVLGIVLVVLCWIVLGLSRAFSTGA